MGQIHRPILEAHWQQTLDEVVEAMREMSRQTDPQAMVRAYAARMSHLTGFDRTVSVSRRGLTKPSYRITRSSTWTQTLNPWKETKKLPMFEGGLLGEMIYGEEPRFIDELIVAPDDPAAEYFAGMGSLIAIPHFDGGESLNFVVHMRREPRAFDPEGFPQFVLMSGLFGRATQNLVLSGELREAYAAVDRELKTVADMQRSLLPAVLPKIPGLGLAVHYETWRYAGGDYYDFFELPEGKWGILIADVSGHGTPAAVMMAILHSIAHFVPGEQQSPARMLDVINRRLTGRYTGGAGTFVTAFYGVFDPASRTLTYSSAGHHPPRLKRCADGSVALLDGARGLPLGIDDEHPYCERTVQLTTGDIVLFYTDGITEAWSPSGEMFGSSRLDEILGRCLIDADATVREVLAEIQAFTDGVPPTDDRTLLAALVE